MHLAYYFDIRYKLNFATQMSIDANTIFNVKINLRNSFKGNRFFFISEFFSL